MEARVLCIWIMAVGLLAADDIAAQSPGKIYRCIVNEQIVFTDRACEGGEAGSEVELAPVNLSSAATAESSARSQASRKSNRASDRTSDRAMAEQKSIAAEHARAKQRCDRLNDQLATIQARMRAGYSVREGERLRERQRSLEAQRRTERCRR